MGFAGETFPTHRIQNVIGFPPYNGTTPDVDLKIYHPVGEEVWDFKNEKGYFKFRYPISYRVIDDFWAMEEILNNIFENVLKINPTEHPILYLIPPMNPSKTKEKIAETFFEKFDIPKLAFAQTEVLSLVSSNSKAGVVIDSGVEMTSIVPIYMGFILAHAYNRMDIGGWDIESVIKRYSIIRGDKIFKSSYREYRSLLKTLKHDYSFFTLASKEDLDFKPFDVENNVITVDKGHKLGDEQFVGPEIFYHPEIIGKETMSLAKCIVDAISHCDEEIIEELYSSIILTGGNTLIPNFKKRLDLEMKKLVPEGIKFNIITLSNRDLRGWIGGSILASRYKEKIKWITKEQFDKEGAKIIHTSHVDVSDLPQNFEL